MIFTHSIPFFVRYLLEKHVDRHIGDIRNVLDDVIALHPFEFDPVEMHRKGSRLWTECVFLWACRTLHSESDFVG